MMNHSLRSTAKVVHRRISPGRFPRVRPFSSRPVFCVDVYSSAIVSRRPTTLMHGGRRAFDTASVLMMDVGKRQSETELLLQEADFPDYFINMAHPDDLKPLDTPLEPEFIEHDGIFGHHRLLFRVSFKMNDGTFVPFTFVIDTGAPFHFYLEESTSKTLHRGGRILSADVSDYMDVVGTKAAVHETPSTYPPANIIGLKMLRILGFTYDKDGHGFKLPFDHF